MTQLRELGLHSNRFITTIPAELCYLTAMTATLDFHGSSLFGSLPANIGALSKMVYLGIEGGDLTGTLPPSLGLLTKMHAPLVLTSNLLTGTIPTQLGKLVGIEGLFLRANQTSHARHSAVAGIDRKKKKSCFFGLCMRVCVLFFYNNNNTDKLLLIYVCVHV